MKLGAPSVVDAPPYLQVFQGELEPVRFLLRGDNSHREGLWGGPCCLPFCDTASLAESIAASSAGQPAAQKVSQPAVQRYG